MKIIETADITAEIKKLCLNLGVTLNSGVCSALKNAYDIETGNAKFALEIMLDNAKIAKETDTPLCQDTGMAVVFAEIGTDARINGDINAAINLGVREAYKDGYFRMSVLDPITRVNTKDNTPAVIHYSFTEGDSLVLKVMLKGFGSENMSKLFMLTPSQGINGIKDAVIETVKSAGGNPCPPIVVGIGIGGTMEKAAILSKHALFREIGSENADKSLTTLENDLLKMINALGIGAQGFGGKTTALGVFIEKFPTHLAGLPVAITIQCHAVRHGEVTL
jgi:fumarate hydratase subunit alpha